MTLSEAYSSYLLTINKELYRHTRDINIMRIDSMQGRYAWVKVCSQKSVRDTAKNLSLVGLRVLNEFDLRPDGPEGEPSFYNILVFMEVR